MGAGARARRSNFYGAAARFEASAAKATASQTAPLSPARVPAGPPLGSGNQVANHVRAALAALTRVRPKDARDEQDADAADQPSRCPSARGDPLTLNRADTTTNRLVVAATTVDGRAVSCVARLLTTAVPPGWCLAGVAFRVALRYAQARPSGDGAPAATTGAAEEPIGLLTAEPSFGTISQGGEANAQSPCSVANPMINSMAAGRGGGHPAAAPSPAPSSSMNAAGSAAANVARGGAAAPALASTCEGAGRRQVDWRHTPERPRRRSVQAWSWPTPTLPFGLLARTNYARGVCAIQPRLSSRVAAPTLATRLTFPLLWSIGDGNGRRLVLPRARGGLHRRALDRGSYLHLRRCRSVHRRRTARQRRRSACRLPRRRRLVPKDDGTPAGRRGQPLGRQRPASRAGVVDRRARCCCSRSVVVRHAADPRVKLQREAHQRGGRAVAS